ncbi:hypothetical protein H4Q32_008708 [Labeo rohita]|uniref:Integrase catalytic domain-containing protein n=1 Tax=Labeo rohita TaxID=84645 RepID=A0ABQ8M3B4_LABRO|nr:hypothetical protein H4Q32_008708 [Labeo rohita]
MKYKPGQDNVTADCLSRLPLPVTAYSQEQEPEMVAVLSPEFAAVTVEDLKSMCDACPILRQHDRMANTHVAPLYPVPTPTTAWEKLTIDVVGPLNNTPPGCRFAMTLIDNYGKWPEIAFAPDVTSATVVKFLSTTFSREENPLELVTDNGSQFVSAEFEAFLADRDIKHYHSSVYYPQANGEIERFNRVFKDCLQTASIEGREWKAFVTEFLHTEQLHML